ncbi:MAG: hypothetical protein GJ680_18625 [Alteromonadaceae bacterium]|nr:hypothetical protein [Alteromonadaceae bacterium]
MKTPESWKHQITAGAKMYAEALVEQLTGNASSVSLGWVSTTYIVTALSQKMSLRQQSKSEVIAETIPVILELERNDLLDAILPIIKRCDLNGRRDQLSGVLATEEMNFVADMMTQLTNRCFFHHQRTALNLMDVATIWLLIGVACFIYHKQVTMTDAKSLLIEYIKTVPFEQITTVPLNSTLN